MSKKAQWMLGILAGVLLVGSLVPALRHGDWLAWTAVAGAALMLVGIGVVRREQRRGKEESDRATRGL
jgi:hypothetical protein